MRIIVVPEDQCVIVDDDALSGLTLPAAPNVHAIQWHGTYGIIEKKAGPAERFTDESVLAPYLAVWQVRRDEIDNPPEPPEPTLAEAKAAKAAAVKRKRDLMETQGFMHLGKPFDSDERSVLRITQAALTAQVAGAGFTIDWTAADNSVVTLNQAAMLGMPAALATRANALHQHAAGLKAQIVAAADAAALLAIDIDAGWPAL